MKLKKTAEDYFLKQSKTNQTKGLFTTNIESKLYPFLYLITVKFTALFIVIPKQGPKRHMHI